MKFEIEIPDEIGEDRSKKLIKGLDNEIERIMETDLIDKPLKNFLKGKYTTLDDAYYVNFSSPDHVNRLYVDFTHEGEMDAKDLFRRIVEANAYDKYVKLEHHTYKWCESYKVRTDGIKNVDELKKLFRKPLR